MPIEVKVPQIGESIQEGVIARWLKKNGDLVRRDEPLLELETEKATSEIPSPPREIWMFSVREGKAGGVVPTMGNIEEKNVPAAQPPARKKQAAAKPAEPQTKPETAKPAAKPATTATAGTDGRQAPAL